MVDITSSLYWFCPMNILYLVVLYFNTVLSSEWEVEDSMRDVSRILISLSYVAAFLAVVWLKREKIGQKQGLEMAFSEVNKYYNVQLEKYSGNLSDHFFLIFNKRVDFIQDWGLVRIQWNIELDNEIKWGASCRWSSFQKCKMQNSIQMIIVKTHSTLDCFHCGFDRDNTRTFVNRF